MRGFDTRLKNKRGELKPIEWSEACRLMREKYDDRENWILVSHLTGLLMFLTLEHKFYEGAKAKDFTQVATFWNGEPYVICAMRKEHLTPKEYAGVVRTLAGYDLSPAELESQDVNISAPPDVMADAFYLAQA